MNVNPNIVISAPHIVIPQAYWTPLLGEILREADLITSTQLQTALRDKGEYQGQRIGEILALQGWLKQETVDFFAEQWTTCLQQGPQYPIGEYLKQAGLIDETQIQQILREQQQIKLKFGQIAVGKGLVKQKTLDFFLNSLFCHCAEESLFVA
ncbi:hypothetical protein VB715_19850 [Crocosphaera sp. UHCC 0190]|uniref:hypothetical protein n=1 Tax=Crocosphaera sp. UHCC 0190 TaxID=3110246 RepID=UPI002B2208D4|nr:hypothetical protein [Crocosphaera sp. UHCC 0190]MEA5512030.1 hypothetical protein [Crocosphaera sp. UHCC 0190]